MLENNSNILFIVILLSTPSMLQHHNGKDKNGDCYSDLKTGLNQSLISLLNQVTASVITLLKSMFMVLPTCFVFSQYQLSKIHFSHVIDSMILSSEISCQTLSFVCFQLFLFFFFCSLFLFLLKTKDKIGLSRNENIL